MYHTAVCIVRRYQRSSLFLEVVEDTAITHHNCKTTTSTPVSIAALRNMFAHYRIPEQLVSENGSQFLSEEMHQFPAANGVKHIRYHPSTNGAVKRLIKLLNMHRNQDINVEFHWSRLGATCQHHMPLQELHTSHSSLNVIYALTWTYSSQVLMHGSDSSRAVIRGITTHTVTAESAAVQWASQCVLATCVKDHVGSRNCG